MQKKPLSPEEFRNHTEAQLNDPSLALKGQNPTTVAQTRTEHYATGINLLKQVSETLQTLANNPNNPSAKQQVNLALKHLDNAGTAFGMASLCQDVVHDKDDTSKT